MYVLEYEGLPVSMLSISEMERWCDQSSVEIFSRFTVWYVDENGHCWAVARETF